jgi:hypothetical protein
VEQALPILFHNLFLDIGQDRVKPDAQTQQIPRKFRLLKTSHIQQICWTWLDGY